MRLLALPPVLVAVSTDGPVIRWLGRTGIVPREREEQAPASRVLRKSPALTEGDFDFEALPRGAATG